MSPGAQGWDARSRGEALTSAFRRAWARSDRADRGSAVRAMTALGKGCADDAARHAIFSEAQRHAALASFVDLVGLARVHAPALPDALAAVRKASDDPARRESALDGLAMLVGGDVDRFDELARAVTHEQGAHRWPARLADASRSAARIDPDRVLRAAASVHPYYRALAHALVAPLLEGPSRSSAIAAALENEADPSLGDARPFVALAPILDEPSCLRATALASRLYPSPSAGATALAHLLPRLASFGHQEDALARARALPTAEERAVALANVASTLVDASAQEKTMTEALRLLAESSGVGIALVAPRLVPLGYGPFLLELRGAREPGALLAMMQAASGVERAELATELARTGEPEWLVPVARELPLDVLAPRVAYAFEDAASRSPGEILEDETGYGLVPWMPLVAVVSEDDAAAAISGALAAS